MTHKFTKCFIMFVHCSVIYNSQDLERAKCPSVDEFGACIKRLWYIYTMEYYVAIKQKEVLPFVQNGWTWRLLQ